ncbi:MAG: hypothetical protein G01um101477_586 [Candidatus Doudnabacteria bacterium Gr01-1014_77]|uniref:Uncharacterized protein n=1 Tax=Candidatus Doudnabacteria bacterium Gr01-1014_77 TaxID=2017133 RepID=A0A554JA85_9BACT|nr:MAG: hypothetical protein G01um101477_586 [Candidatus Doudnabacteria bacterium Gr01-1014_77]
MQSPEKQTPEFYKQMFSVKVHGSPQLALDFFESGNLRVLVTLNWDIHLGSDWHHELRSRFGIDSEDIAVEGYVGKHEDTHKAELRIVQDGWHLERLGVQGDERVVIDAIEEKVDETMDMIASQKQSP